MKYYLENFSENERKVITVSLDLCCANPVSILYSLFDTARYHYDHWDYLTNEDIYWLSVAVDRLIEDFKQLYLSSVFHDYYFDIYCEANDFSNKLSTMIGEDQSEDREEPEQDEDQSEDNKELEQDEAQIEDREEPEQNEDQSEDNKGTEQDEAQSEDNKEPEQDEAQIEDREEPEKDEDKIIIDNVPDEECEPIISVTKCFVDGELERVVTSVKSYHDMYIHFLFSSGIEKVFGFNQDDGLLINPARYSSHFVLHGESSNEFYSRVINTYNLICSDYGNLVKVFISREDKCIGFEESYNPLDDEELPF